MDWSSRAGAYFFVQNIIAALKKANVKITEKIYLIILDLNKQIFRPLNPWS